jgi:hypothetical protein
VSNPRGKRGPVQLAELEALKVRVEAVLLDRGSSWDEALRGPPERVDGTEQYLASLVERARAGDRAVLKTVRHVMLSELTQDLRAGRAPSPALRKYLLEAIARGSVDRALGLQRAEGGRPPEQDVQLAAASIVGFLALDLDSEHEALVQTAYMLGWGSEKTMRDALGNLLLCTRIVLSLRRRDPVLVAAIGAAKAVDFFLLRAGRETP